MASISPTLTAGLSPATPEARTERSATQPTTTAANADESVRLSMAAQVKSLRQSGQSVDAIAAALSLTVKEVNSYLNNAVSEAASAAAQMALMGAGDG